MSLTEHIAAQRTDHGVPHALSCRALGVAPSTFYEQHSRPPSAARQRRERLDAAVKACFEASGGTYGSPRVRAQLRRDRPHRVQEVRGGLHGPPGAPGPPQAAPQGPDTARQVRGAGV